MAAREETMAAGRELDAEVARVVFGVADIRMRAGKWGPEPRPWAATPCGRNFGVPGHAGVGALCHSCRKMVPRYSTSIAAAWTVVEHMRQDGYQLEMQDTDATTHRDIWEVTFRALDVRSDGWGHGETAPLAICRAALSALRPATRRAGE